MWLSQKINQWFPCDLGMSSSWPTSTALPNMGVFGTRSSYKPVACNPGKFEVLPNVMRWTSYVLCCLENTWTDFSSVRKTTSHPRLAMSGMFDVEREGKWLCGVKYQSLKVYSGEPIFIVLHGGPISLHVCNHPIAIEHHHLKVSIVYWEDFLHPIQVLQLCCLWICVFQARAT